MYAGILLKYALHPERSTSTLRHYYPANFW